MTRSKRVSVPLFIGLSLVVAVSLTAVPGSPSAHAAGAAVGLGNAGSFAVLAATTVTNTGPTIVSGDLGVNAGSAVTGFPPGIVNNGTIHATDTLSGLAQQDLVTAYNDAAGRTPTTTGLVALDGLTLAPGVYSGGALSLGGTLTLNGGANDVFIFQASSTLITGTGSHVLLTGGATECNVFWQVASSATLNAGSAFVGTVMALTSVTAKTGATVSGRLLARTGAVTLDTNVITRPTSCGTSGIAPPATPVPGRARFTG
ncbi:MAG: ice-binding family protein [Lacisediminihabitans sp.]